MQHTQPFRSCVLLLKCFNCMDAFAECDLLRLPFLKAICFSKQTAGLILIYLSKFLSTPTLSHRRDTKQGYEFRKKLYQAALLSFVFYLLPLHIYEPYFMDWPLSFFSSYDSKLSRTSQAQKMQGLRKSITFYWRGSSMFHVSMLLRSRAKESTREITER